MQGEEQLGPYSEENLLEYATGGNITRESLVWTEGMAEWLPASQIGGLFPVELAPIQVATTAKPVHVALGGPARNSYTPSGMRPAIGSDDPYTCVGIKPASFGLWVSMFLGGFVVMIIGVVMLFSAAASVAAASNSNGGEPTAAQAGGMGMSGLIILVGCLVTTFSFIPVLITLHRAWSCLQPGGMARSTPGKAIGFLFIPFFNYYWIFQAFNGFAADWNRTVSSYTDLKAAPRMSEGVFLTFCIGNFVPPLGPIMLFPVMSQLCKGVNFFAYRPKPGSSGLFGGGLRFGGSLRS